MKEGRSERLYLADIRDAIDKIQRYTAKGRAAFFADAMMQDAVVRNLEIIGEAVKNLSARTRETHLDIPWPDIAGMRDQVTHGYFKVDLEIVWDVVANDLRPLREKVVALLSET